MTVNQSKHAEHVVARFNELLTESDAALTATHSQELALLIEAALDTVVVEQLDSVANELEQISRRLRRDEELAPL